MKNPITTITSAVGDWFAPARDGLAGLHGVDTRLRAEDAALEGEVQTLLSTQTSKAEIIAGLPAAIATKGARWIADVGPQIVAALSGAVDVSPASEVTATRLGSLDALETPITLDALCALAPELVERGLTAAIRATQYAEGPDRTELPRLAAELNQRRRDVQARHADLVARAAELGVLIEELSDNRARRLVAAAAQEWRERDERDRARRVRG